MLDDEYCATTALGLGEVQREVECGAHDTKRHDSDQGGGGREAGIHNLKSLADFPDHIPFGDPHLLQAEIGRQMTAMPG
ncbi:hypothetical protein D9M69_525800 [compost metagenome]